MSDDARAERFWWDEHDDDVFVWGEEGDDAWAAGVQAHVDRIDHALRIQWGEPRRYLDLGCGPGRLTFPLARLYEEHHFTGVDISAAMLDRCARTVRLAQYGNTLFRLGDGRTLPRADAPFNGAWSVLLFQHIPPAAQRGYLTAVADALVPDGRFLVQLTADYTTHGQFLHWHTCPSDFIGWARDAGLKTVGVERDDAYPKWTWITLERTS